MHFQTFKIPPPRRLYHLHDQPACCAYGFFNIDSVGFHGLNIISFCWSYRVQNTLDPYKPWIKVTHFFVCGRMKLCLLHSLHLSLCNSSEAGLTYNFSAPVSQMTFARPLQYWEKHAVSNGEEWWGGKAVVVPFFHTSPVVPGGTGLHSSERLLQLSCALRSQELTASSDHELFWDNRVNLSGLCVIRCRWLS